MWMVVGALVMLAVGAALIRFDIVAAGWLLGALLAVCLTMVLVMLWMDRGAKRSAERTRWSPSPRR